ncbi:MAG: phosphoribosylaminoimidazolesuccinocarboxamide synthase [Candidatus Levybacteria bacterium]|nr:phosphoribosylaminoimidazolesuccinocarboxamide synthase [Candidatus Levybacteria bacterium]
MISRKILIESIPRSLSSVNLPKKFGKKQSGKVRDFCVLNGKRIIITTDRQSAFDRVLGVIPFKGQVLTALSAFWFEKTKDIVPNHLISVPDPNVMLVKNCIVIPIEMVIRGYITGITDTSLWGSYEKGKRTIYGIKFPNGLKKNQKLKSAVVTPTTKALSGQHDERLTEEEILHRKTVPPELWKEMKKTALALFARGQKICDKAGIILVDTKYEFGLDENGKLILIDEIHTPDSSRYWIKKSYMDRFKKGLEPESYDKEPLRIWFKEHGYTGEGIPPKMPDDFVVKVSQRYQSIYEKITGKKFQANNTLSPEERIKKNLLKLN